MTKLPSLQAMEILAVSDQPVFESLMDHIGLHVEGKVNEDPLETRVQTESVAAIASEITEEAHGFVECDSRLGEFKQMAEDYGYVVSFE
jgi:hypothetical protein